MRGISSGKSENKRSLCDAPQLEGWPPLEKERETDRIGKKSSLWRAAEGREIKKMRKLETGRAIKIIHVSRVPSTSWTMPVIHFQRRDARYEVAESGCGTASLLTRALIRTT